MDSVVVKTENQSKADNNRRKGTRDDNLRGNRKRAGNETGEVTKQDEIEEGEDIGKELTTLFFTDNVIHHIQDEEISQLCKTLHASGNLFGISQAEDEKQEGKSPGNPHPKNGIGEREIDSQKREIHNLVDLKMV